MQIHFVVHHDFTQALNIYISFAGLCILVILRTKFLTRGEIIEPLKKDYFSIKLLK